MLLGIVSSCKKDNTLKDRMAVIKDKVWWGQFFYTGKAVEFYAIHFNANGSFTWNEFAGEYQGKWVLDGSQLTISFDGTGSEFKASIDEDDKMSHIINTPAGGINLINGELVATNNAPLENTIWNGTATSGSLVLAIKLSFLPASKVDVKVGSLPPNPPYSYTRFMLGSVIRIGPSLFGIVTSANEMKGSVDKAGYLWQATKQ
jgi:hypothetical protein